MKRILFPTDFSPAADEAMQIAFQLTKNAQAELVIFHALNTVQQFMDLNITSGADLVTPTIQPDLVQDIMASHRKIGEQKMKERIALAKQQDVWIHPEISEQGLDASLEDIVADLNIGFIIMATTGASGISETLIGSNAQKIVRNATVPVLTIRNTKEKLNIESVAFFSDFLDEDNCNQIPRVQHFADWFNAEMKYVFVNTPNYFEPSHVVQNRMNSVLSKHNVETQSGEIFNDFDIAEGVINYGKHNNISVLALVTHSFSGLRKLFNDNVTESVVNHSEIPVLSLHIPSK